MMKYLTLVLAALSLTACSSFDTELQDHLEAEQDFHAHQQYLESIYNVDNYGVDCYAYIGMACEDV